MLEPKRLVCEIENRRRRQLPIVMIGLVAASIGAIVGASSLRPAEPAAPTWLELQQPLNQGRYDSPWFATETGLLDNPNRCETRDAVRPFIARLVKWGLADRDLPMVQHCLARTRDRAWVLAQLQALDPSTRDLVVFHLTTPADPPRTRIGNNHPGYRVGVENLGRGHEQQALPHLRTWLAEQDPQLPDPGFDERRYLTLVVETLEARAEGVTE